jgi:hypothetical protein
MTSNATPPQKTHGVQSRSRRGGICETTTNAPNATPSVCADREDRHEQWEIHDDAAKAQRPEYGRRMSAELNVPE